MRIALLVFMPAGFLAASPAAAQDLSIATENLRAAGSIAGTMAMNSHLYPENSRRGSCSMNRSRHARQAQACANLSRFRREYGAGHPQVRQPTRHCRNAGY